MRGPQGGCLETEFAPEPLTAKCAEIFQRREHICLGISPFNSYFKRTRSTQMCHWAAREIRNVQFHLPDGPSTFTLQAKGCPPTRRPGGPTRTG